MFKTLRWFYADYTRASLEDTLLRNYGYLLSSVDTRYTNVSKNDRKIHPRIVLVWWQADAREEAMTIGVETSQKGTTVWNSASMGAILPHFLTMDGILKRHFRKALFVCRLDLNGCPQSVLQYTMHMQSAKTHWEQKLPLSPLKD